MTHCPLLDIVQCVKLLNKTFGKSALLLSAGKEGPSLMDPLYRAILRH